MNSVRDIIRPGNPRLTSCTPERTDEREQLFNQQEVGPIERVATPIDAITLLYRVMIDIDLHLFRPEHLVTCGADPTQFYRRLIAPMLARNTVLSRAEVRVSGMGLHVIIRFAEPVEFITAGERQRWAGIVKTIQRLLPTDPDSPGLNALTRPIGSINSRTGSEVHRLTIGEPVAITDVISLFEQVVRARFSTVAGVLFGERLSPCPLCWKDGTRLGVLGREGHCYGSCGRVRLAHLYRAFLGERRTGHVGE